MERILVVGCSGSGKTSLAKKIAQKMKLPFVATDPLYWQANWQLSPQEQFLKNLKELVAQEQWVMDGNFEDQRDWVWPRATTILWLDYPKPLVMTRLLKRNLGLVLTQETTWSGNTMSLKRAFLGFKHAWRSYKHKKVHYPKYLSQHPYKKVLHFKTPNEARAWLDFLAT